MSGLRLRTYREGAQQHRQKHTRHDYTILHCLYCLWCASDRTLLDHVTKSRLQTGGALAARRALQLRRTLCAGVLPAVPLAVPIFEEHVGFRQVVLDKESRRALIEVDHAARVAVRGSAEIEDVVAPDFRRGLIGENVDGAAVAHTLHVIVDPVVQDPVVTHGVVQPQPTLMPEYGISTISLCSMVRPRGNPAAIAVEP